MALFSRRSRGEVASNADEDGFDDFEEFSDEPPVPASADLPPNRLRDWEIPGAYASGAVVAILAILELVVTKGSGAPKHSEPIFPIIGLVLIAGQVATVRLANRLLTAAATVLAALAIFYDKVPSALSAPRIAGFFIPFLYAFLVIQRHSRAQKALLPPRGSRRGATSSNARGSRGKKAPEPTGIPASRRYTPPKPKVDPNAKKRR
jgi:hypothetical protein